MVLHRPAMTKSTYPHRPLQWKRQYPLSSPSPSFPFFKTSNEHMLRSSFTQMWKTKQKKTLLSLIFDSSRCRRVCDRSISLSPAKKNNSRCRFNAHMSCKENRRTRWPRYCGRCLDKCLRLSVPLFISWRNIDTQIFAKGQWVKSDQQRKQMGLNVVGVWYLNLVLS